MRYERALGVGRSTSLGLKMAFASRVLIHLFLRTYRGRARSGFYSRGLRLFEMKVGFARLLWG